MDDESWDAILKTVAAKPRSDKDWMAVYATMLLANALDRWLEGICAELGRIADGLGARVEGETEMEGE